MWENFEILLKSREKDSFGTLPKLIWDEGRQSFVFFFNFTEEIIYKMK